MEKTDKDKENKERGASKAKERFLEQFFPRKESIFFPPKKVTGWKRLIQTEK